MKLFKAEMFNELYNNTIQDGKYLSDNPKVLFKPDTLPQDYADLANEILNELIYISPTVYSSSLKDECWWQDRDENDKYSAKLMFKELLENKQTEIIYVDSGVTLNGEKLYKQEIKWQKLK